MIEAAILRKPVLSLVTPEFAGTQEGTLHFRYLLPEHGGFLRVAHSFGEHQAQLAEALARPDVVRAQTEGFVRTFLRPHGLDVPCTPVIANAFERAASVRSPMRRPSLASRVFRLVLAPLALLVYWADRDDSTRSKKTQSVDVRTRVGRELKEMRKGVMRPVALMSSAARSFGRTSMRRLTKGARSGRRAIVRWTRLARYNVATRVLGRGAPKSGDMRP